MDEEQLPEESQGSTLPQPETSDAAAAQPTLHEQQLAAEAAGEQAADSEAPDGWGADGNAWPVKPLRSSGY